MNLVKICFFVPFFCLISTESLPVAQPPIIPSHVLHIRKDFPGIISFGPIFISSVKRGIFTDHVSIHPFPYGSNDYSVDLPFANCQEKQDVKEIIEVEEPLGVISEQEDKPGEEDGGEIDDLISDYNDFLNKSTLTSEQIYLIQMSELARIREKELNVEFEVLNQVKEVPDELEPEKDIKTPVQNDDYEHVEYTNPEPNVPQELEIGAEVQENPSGIQDYEHNRPEPEFENDSDAPQTLPSEPYEPMESVHETIELEEPVSGSFDSIPEEIQEGVQEPEEVEESSADANIWGGPTSPEVAQSVSEYVENHKPGEIYLCPPKDSTQISERHDNFIKSSQMGARKRIKNYFDGVRAYAARYDDSTGFM